MPTSEPGVIDFGKIGAVGLMASWLSGWLVGSRKFYLSPYKAILCEAVQWITACDGLDPYVDGLLFQRLHASSRLRWIIIRGMQAKAHTASMSNIYEM